MIFSHLISEEEFLSKHEEENKIMAITSAMEATLAIFSEDGMTHLGFLTITNEVTLNKIFWTTFTTSGAKDDYGMGNQVGNVCYLCPGQNPQEEHKFQFNHTNECSKLYDFSLLGFDTEQVFKFDVNTRVKTKFKATCKFVR